ncbi:MAG: hypothetical protein ACKO7D_02810 [Bacteroidota bacterium]
MRLFFLFLTLGITISSCSKYEGEGGSSTIKGLVREQRFNSLGNLISEYLIADQDVFIIYGNESNFYDDDIKTSYDGSFEFRYLKKGNYKIFVYEDCNTCPSGVKEVLIPVEITENNQIIDLDTIDIKKL